MRIQILPLPSYMVGDDMEEPFALIVDGCQYDNLELVPSDVRVAALDRWKRFGEEDGARAVFVTDETIEVVSQYADA